MLRVAKRPIDISETQVTLDDDILTLKGSKGIFIYQIDKCIKLELSDKRIQVNLVSNDRRANKLAGTTRAILANGVKGVMEGFKEMLQLVGVGCRAQIEGKKVTLNLGYSHPIIYEVPEGVSIKVPTPLEIVIEGSDKQQVRQVAAKIRQFRPPDAYKGKGIRYAGEKVKLKEAKKK